jgi:O-antigen ligase
MFEGEQMTNWSSVLRLLLLTFLVSSEDRIDRKRSVQILMLTGGLLLLTLIFAWFFQEQIGKSFLNIAIVVFVVFFLVARSIVYLIDLRNKS